MSGRTAATHGDTGRAKLMAYRCPGNAQLGTDLTKSPAVGVQVGCTFDVHCATVTASCDLLDRDDMAGLARRRRMRMRLWCTPWCARCLSHRGSSCPSCSSHMRRSSAGRGRSPRWRLPIRTRNSSDRRVCTGPGPGEAGHSRSTRGESADRGGVSYVVRGRPTGLVSERATAVVGARAWSRRSSEVGQSF
jgi:hypothetical protein